MRHKLLQNHRVQICGVRLAGIYGGDRRQRALREAAQAGAKSAGFSGDPIPTAFVENARCGRSRDSFGYDNNYMAVYLTVWANAWPCFFLVSCACFQHFSKATAVTDRFRVRREWLSWHQFSCHDRYELLMEAFGGEGYAVNSASQLATACRQAFAAKRPALINVQIDPMAGVESGHVTSFNAPKSSL